MNVSDLNSLIVYPVLQAMGGKFNDPRARRLLVAICDLESGLIHREQYPVGPAVSIWQMERGGGVAGVMTHRLTKPIMREWCLRLIVPATIDAVYEAIRFNDQLACVAARLLLYSDPAPLPTDREEAYAYYLRTWRPGRPRPQDWPAAWDAAR